MDRQAVVEITETDHQDALVGNADNSGILEKFHCEGAARYTPTVIGKVS
jgi:hypothetical protein